MAHPLDVLLLSPARWQLALADGQVGVFFDVAESVHKQRVGFTESHVVQGSKRVLGLGLIGVSKEDESAQRSA